MRILLAEDDRIFQLVLGKALTQWGYEPIIVNDGDQALRKLIDGGGPHLAILDWMMPRLTARKSAAKFGLTTCRNTAILFC